MTPNSTTSCTWRFLFSDEIKLLFDVGVLASGGVVFLCILDAHLFLGRQLVPHRRQFQPSLITASVINQLLSFTIDYCRHGRYCRFLSTINDAFRIVWVNINPCVTNWQDANCGRQTSSVGNYVMT